MKLSSIFKEMLLEIGDKTYPISIAHIVKSSPKNSRVKYYFDTAAGTEYEVVFDSEFNNEDNKWITDVSFDIVMIDNTDAKNLYSETGEGDAIAVLYTVAKAVRKFIDTFKPEFLRYAGAMTDKEMTAWDKKSTVSKSLTVRDRINDRMLDKMSNDYPDYSFKRDGFMMTIFYNKELPVPGHHKIFNYPVNK